MKKVSYILIFIGIVCLFIMLYYGTYYYTKKTIKDQSDTNISNTLVDNPALQEVTDVAGVTEEIIKKDTAYTVEYYDLETKKMYTEEENLPVAYIGFNREDMLNYISEYDYEEEDDIVNMQLVSFSSDALTIRKTYEKEEETLLTNKYWILEDDGMLTVYKEDKQTVYIETGISCSKLSRIEQNLCEEEGIPFENVHDLYNYLESCTS